MVTIDDIKYVLYGVDDDAAMVERFVSHVNERAVPYADESELGALLEKFRAGGVASKEVLVLKPFRGRFFQMCPGSPNVVCCRYRLLNTCFDCFYNCTYCYLLSYLNFYGIMQFTNTGRLREELMQFIDDADSDMIYRIGTGEFTDSLMMDDITGIGEELVTMCSAFPNIMLELKTKSSNIDHLLGIPNKGNAVIGWSLNTPRNIELYEEGTASLDQRVRAASRAEKAGYYLAFHFDPIILYDGWEEDYLRVIEELMTSVDPEKIVWISMGGFRFLPEFKHVMREHFPGEAITSQEMFPGIDGKLRYFKPVRLAMYRFFREHIEKYTRYPFLYMCMETPEMWDRVFGIRHQESSELELAFSHHLKTVFFS